MTDEVAESFPHLARPDIARFVLPRPLNQMSEADRVTVGQWLRGLADEVLQPTPRDDDWFGETLVLRES